MPTALPPRCGQFRIIKPGSADSVPMFGQRGPPPEPKLSDIGLVDFRRVCKQVGILDEATDTIRAPPIKAPSE